MNANSKRVADDLMEIAEGLRNGTVQLTGYNTAIKGYGHYGYSSKEVSIQYVQADKEPK